MFCDLKKSPEKATDCVQKSGRLPTSLLKGEDSQADI